ncbi:MAG: hypoxanthine phosphoribosyltransferase [Pirellulales bacterium]|nr:hypoxanthine phosphoribosyltransferase [Pirellulales bacterium]
MKTLLTEAQLREGIERLAAEIGRHYGSDPLTVVGVLTGSIIVLADLIRRLDMPLSVGLVQARSYRGPATTPGELTLHAELLPEVRDRRVLVLDDIFDTGQTLARLLDEIRRLKPSTLQSAVLLRKRGRSRVSFDPDFVGFEIPDEFVVGYGLDYQDAYRNLPYVAALEPADLAAGRES